MQGQTETTDKKIESGDMREGKPSSDPTEVRENSYSQPHNDNGLKTEDRSRE